MASAQQQTNRSTSSGVLSRATLAVVLAFGFWAWVINNNDPDRQHDFPTVLVIENNLPDGLAATLPSPNAVTISVWGPRSVVQNAQAGNVSATIDLKEVKPGTQQVPVHVQSNLSNLRKKSANPVSVQVTIERSIEKTLPVTVPMPTQSGVKVNSVAATPPDVQVSGPESKVNSVTQLVAAFEIGDRTANFTSPPVDVKALDVSGREVSGVTLSPSRVAVTADITDNRNERTVPVSTADVVGTPAPGYIFNGFGSIPQVTITGDPQVIRSIVNIPTQPISIDGLGQNKVITVQLDTTKLPPGVTIKDTVTTVQVQANIVEITQNIDLKVRIQPVNLRPGLQPSLSQAEATVTLRGTRQQLDQINGTNILALVNLAGFTGPSAAKDVSVDIQLPSGSPVQIVKVDPSSIQVTATALPTPTAIPPPTPRPTPTPTATPHPSTATAAP
ncbi:MAG: CdaR family protein [Chloroflexota bacterium]|nr:CdaR family protein [Chloroflexota bacterium]